MQANRPSFSYRALSETLTETKTGTTLALYNKRKVGTDLQMKVSSNITITISTNLRLYTTDSHTMSSQKIAVYSLSGT